MPRQFVQCGIDWRRRIAGGRIKLSEVLGRDDKGGGGRGRRPGQGPKRDDGACLSRDAHQLPAVYSRRGGGRHGHAAKVCHAHAPIAPLMALRPGAMKVLSQHAFKVRDGFEQAFAQLRTGLPVEDFARLRDIRLSLAGIVLG